MNGIDSSMNKVAMLQPNYIPWKGVFDLINCVDVFVFYDDVQYTKKDWRNRNKIKTKEGDIWLTVPVKSKRDQLICEAEIDNSTNWQEKHFKTIKNNYSKAKYFSEYEYLLEEIYLNKTWGKISELDIFSTKLISKALDIGAEWVVASELNISGGKDGEKVIKICKQLKCDHFINGPSAKSFMDEEKFVNQGMALEYMEYNYDEYSQIHPPFSHHVSALDVIFNCGKDAKKYVCKFNPKLG